MPEERLEAGRTLDAEVGQKVLGWKPELPIIPGHARGIQPGKSIPQEYPHFSTDAVASDLVVKEMQKRGF
jgi:hypothetical protein